MNEIILLGSVLAFTAALASLWLVRERDIDRAPVELAIPHPEAHREPEPEPVPA
jgi:hypothetical protein